MNSRIHIYGQKSFQGDAWIILNREGAEKLRFCIQNILEGSRGVDESFETFANDGKRYTIHIKIDEGVFERKR